jgi:hypothetical protein
MPYPANFHNQEEAPESVRPADGLAVAKAEEEPAVIINEVDSPIWVSVSEAAKLGGVQAKTIRRAIEGKKIVFKVKDNRYCIEIGSVFRWLLSSSKSKKKFLKTGVIQYFRK